LNTPSLAAKRTHLTHPKYRADIDGLRAVAILSVVAFHAFPYWMQGGFIGVDIFFVISGFLISTIIFDSLERERFSFIEFYSKRIKRIFPALLLVLIASYSLGWLVLFADEYKQLGKHIAGGAGFISNFILWNESGYFDSLANTKPLLHLWSLAIEEQFYIIWPLVLTFFWKWKKGFVAITSIVAVFSFAANIYFINRYSPSSFYLPITRFWELMIGCGLAYIALHKPNLNSRLQNTQSLLGAILLVIGFLLVNKVRAFPGWWALLPTLGAFFIISAGQHAWINKHVLSSKILVWFGLISYPLYLWHWPILSFVHIVEGQLPLHDRAIRVGAVLVSIVLAWLTYKLIEKPIRFGNFNKIKTITLVGLMTIIGLVGYATYQLDGLSFRVKKIIELSNVKGISSPVSLSNETCNQLFPQFNKFTGCSISHQGQPNIAMIGDSHSRQYYFSLANALPQDTVMNLVNVRCLPFSSQTHQSLDGCKEKFNLTVDFLKNQKSIKTVYLAGYWSYLAAGGFGIVEDGWKLPNKLTAEESLSFQQNGEHFISSLIASGKEVIVIRDTPDLSFAIKSCLYSMPLRFHSSETKVGVQCAMNKSEYERRIAEYDLALNQVLTKFPNVRVYDPKAIFCDSKLCWGIRENRLLYNDGDHTSAFASDLVIKDLLSIFPSHSK
jgi:peptidoglycan/LPS O-acetylase OafA/YrhL